MTDYTLHCGTCWWSLLSLLASLNLGDRANPDLADTDIVEDKVTGQLSKADAVWVRTGLKKSQYERAEQRRVAEKSFTTKDTSQGTLQAIERRMSGFAA